MLLTADLGFSVVEPFTQAYPDRFVNVGVAEQNMIGVATGLAEAGFLPFCYSIATFATLRPYEFIRNGPVAHQLPVRIVGVGGGFDYGTGGSTHHSLEDIAVMRALPGMMVLAPIDGPQAAAALESLWSVPSPVYFRLGKDSPPVAISGGRFELERAQIMCRGADVLLISTGALVAETMSAAGALANAGVLATVLSVPCLAPAPLADLRTSLADARAVLTIEAHQQAGGLGSLVAEVLAEAGLARPFRRLTATQPDAGRGGSAAWLLERNGLTSDRIAAAAQTLLS
ncbi:1-deoxy-D-xylulose-5-phosphate synthase [Mesorhizobium sp. M00.F.Ca.ET.186.01.1.1]|nr:1-deoxy-D-xylulose-5-phosphate synthase [bacterium M00.F.Ca.ET.205.01.1.1]TGU54098.1 1-deoxy-D-xylulose-5-phosphate synthase [bacterium M00.F.Ca.ET.152.01.1.1]TGV36846.1 1-deoxy-D-xylulose-5-phosphate synthase [Mesorhizobium sp. M00.F.Ca.ET.186.01.1.1]TGZ41783.1 1-deoxy-D-xylulose-5-phosphate synthase [bacterium M00.F.Ca.ET.162.01.1.1]